MLFLESKKIYIILSYSFIICRNVTDMRASLIWEKFIIDSRKIVTAEDIGKMSVEISKDKDQVIDYLQHNGYIVRILKGIFYVRSIEERRRRTYEHTLYQMVAMALEVKGVRKWYFGLETALKFNAMTHEYYLIDYVLTDSYRTTKVIKILDTDFRFIQRGKRRFDKGIKIEKGIRYSLPEKTVLDLSYRSYLNTRKKEMYLSPIREYRDSVNLELLWDYLDSYPPGFREGVEESI